MALRAGFQAIIGTFLGQKNPIELPPCVRSGRRSSTRRYAPQRRRTGDMVGDSIEVDHTLSQTNLKLKVRVRMHVFCRLCLKFKTQLHHLSSVMLFTIKCASLFGKTRNLLETRI